MKIPAGVNSGSTLRVRGEGDVGPRGYDPFIHLDLIVTKLMGCTRLLKGEKEIF